MSSVDIHSVPSDLTPDQQTTAAKVLRSLYTQLRDRASLSICMDLIQAAGNSDGWMPIAGEQDTALALAACRGANARLSEAGLRCRFAVDKTADWLTARSAAADGATPEQVFAKHAPGPEPGKLVALPDTDEQFSTQAYETAMALLCQAAGQPLVAAAAAGQLSRTTGQPAVYAEAVSALCHVFPWLPDAMSGQRPGVVPDGA